MSQHDMVIDNQPGAPFRGDLNLALAALVGSSNGNVEPTNMFPGMLWLDTASPSIPVLKIRNVANSAWLTIPIGTLPTVTTWQPQFSTTSGTFFYSQQSGVWSRIGRMVTFRGLIVLDNTKTQAPAAQPLQLSALPIPPEAAGWIWPVVFQSLAVSYNVIQLRNSTNPVFVGNTAPGVTNFNNIAANTVITATSSARFEFSGSYIANTD